MTDRESREMPGGTFKHSRLVLNSRVVDVPMASNDFCRALLLESLIFQ
jgi:hypothetical protein